jgi:hypothetical protein
MPKFIPSFAWFLDGRVTEGKGKAPIYRAGAIAMSRRKRQWTADEEAMWDAVYELTATARDEAIKKGRKD